MSAYKNFTFNDPGDPAPWGTIELDAFKDIGDTLVLDTVTGVAAPGTGHHHNRMYSTTNNVLSIEVEASGKTVVKDDIKVVGLDSGLGGKAIIIADTNGDLARVDIGVGKLIYGISGDIVALGPGTDGQVLTSDSSFVSGIEYADNKLQTVYKNSGSVPQTSLDVSGNFPFSLAVDSSGTDVHHVFRTYNKTGTVSGAIRGDGSISLGNTTDATNGNYRYTGTDFEGRVNGGWQSLTKVTEFNYYADDFEEPDSADWAVNGSAALADDTNNAGLRVRLLGLNEGVGFTLIIPAGAVNMTVEISSRPETAPGIPNTVGLGLYERIINGPVGVWSVKRVLSDIDITTDEQWLTDTETSTLSAWGFSAGSEHQVQISRNTPTGGTDLTGDWAVRYIRVTFTN